MLKIEIGQATFSLQLKYAYTFCAWNTVLPIHKDTVHDPLKRSKYPILLHTYRSVCKKKQEWSTMILASQSNIAVWSPSGKYDFWHLLANSLSAQYMDKKHKKNTSTNKNDHTRSPSQEGTSCTGKYGAMNTDVCIAVHQGCVSKPWTRSTVLYV